MSMKFNNNSRPKTFHLPNDDQDIKSITDDDSQSQVDQNDLVSQSEKNDDPYIYQTEETTPNMMMPPYLVKETQNHHRDT